MVREYEMTYIAKEFLIKRGWEILAYNPPGSQGTFTIPNPKKDPTYRGQTGSESPDIVAMRFNKGKKENEILIVEAKPYYHQKDVEKMKTLFTNKERVNIFIQILEKQSIANGNKFNFKLPNRILFGNAHSGKENPVEGIMTIIINQKDNKWNPESFKYGENIFSNFEIIIFNSF